MTILTIAIAGIFGTSSMLIVMSILHRLKLANADMVRAIGSLVTRSYENALLPGLVIHYSFGLVFAFLYSKLLALAPEIAPDSILVITTFTGFVHGLIVGLALQVMVAEFHPLPLFKKVGFAVVVAHIVGHIAYGFGVGLVYAEAWKKLPKKIQEERSKKPSFPSGAPTRSAEE